MTRAFNAVPSATAAILLFAACVNLTRNFAGSKDAGENDGPASSTGGAGGAGTVAPDAAGAGSGGSVVAGGTTTGGMIATGGAGGGLTTGGTSGTAMGGAAGDVAPDAGAVAGTTSSGDGAIDVPLSTDTNLPVDQGTGGTGAGGVTTGGTGGTVTGGATTGGTGGKATGGATTGGTGGKATGGSAGSHVVDAEILADASSPGDGGIDVPLPPDTSLPLDLGTGGSDGPGTGGTGGTGGAGTGGAGTGGATGPMIISVRFVGGRTGGVSGIVAMDPNDIAGVKQAKNWNSASGNQGSLSSLLFADGSTATGASVGWSASDTWTAGFTDTATSSDSRMMSGYLDPRATALPATINVTLPSAMSGAYDVYVYCYGNVDSRTRTYQYAIGTKTHSWTQQGPSATTFPGYKEAPEGGTGDYDYVVFRNLTGNTFTLTATPLAATGGTSLRAPLNGIQIVYPAGS